MKKIGFVISEKANEKRRAILPEDIKQMRHPSCLVFEKGYGEVIEILDDEYLAAGGSTASREEVLACDVVVDVKLGDATYLPSLNPDRILFGWAHAAQKVDFTSAALQGNHTVIAWEEMETSHRNIFYRNREIAGEAALMQAFLYTGRMPYDSKVAILGRGNTAKGALRILHGLGAKVDVFNRKQEKLFVQNIGSYDIIVNCTMWDLKRTERILNRIDLARMRKGSMLIDVSNDGTLSIETSHSTSIDKPVYVVDGILHYVVDNTPAMFPHTVSKEISCKIWPFLDCLAETGRSSILKKATVLSNGEIHHKSVADFRTHLGL